MSGSAEVRAVRAVEGARGSDSLDLAGFGLKAIPPLPGDLQHIRRLDLSGNRLSELPAEIWGLERLEHLDLGGNRLRHLDARVGKLARLESLDASENRLSTLPAELARCKRLTRLDLFTNRLTEIPHAILELASLLELDLARNRLVTLPDFSRRLARLEQLDLAGNHLVELPSSLGTIVGLRRLNLAANRLSSIEPLVTLSRLEELYVDDNALEAIPDELAALPALRLLSVEGNALEELPSGLGHLVAGAERPAARKLEELVSGGYAPGKQYFQAPRYQLEFSLAQRDTAAVAASLDLYYKEFPGNDVQLRFADGDTISLANLGRKAAFHVVGEHQSKEEPAATLEFRPTREQAEVQRNCALAERLLARVPGVDLTPHDGAAYIPDPAEPEPPPAPFRSSGRPSAAGTPRAPAVPAAEPVDAAVFSPPRVAADSVFLVQVFLHPPTAAATVEERALRADPEAVHRGTYSLPLDLPRDTRVDLHLEMPTLSVAEPDATLVWRGVATAAQFEVVVPATGAAPKVIGRVRFAVAGVPAGTLRFQVVVATAGAAPELAEQLPVRSRKYRSAFVSYSSKDRPEVLRRVQAFRIAGLSVFQDILDLEPGERWERALYRRIDSCDVFLLFWSQAAADSEWVAKEIDYAIARKGGDDERPPDIQPVPIEGPPIAPRPERLRHLHFNDALLAQISAADAYDGP